MHLRLVEGKTMVKHDEVVEEVMRLLATEPDDICSQHRSLLDLDMEKLGGGSTVDRQYWVANMRSALSVAQSVALANAILPAMATKSQDLTNYNIPTAGHI